MHIIDCRYVQLMVDYTDIYGFNAVVLQYINI